MLLHSHQRCPSVLLEIMFDSLEYFDESEDDIADDPQAVGGVSLDFTSFSNDEKENAPVTPQPHQKGTKHSKEDISIDN